MKPDRKIVMLAVALALTACSHTSGPVAKGENDVCGAAEYQNYVGKPLSALEGVKLPTQMRAIPHNAAVTMDFNPQRLNFLADADGKIARVYCG